MGKGENKPARALPPIINSVKWKVLASISRCEQATALTVPVQGHCSGIGASLGMEKVPAVQLQRRADLTSLACSCPAPQGAAPPPLGLLNRLHCTLNRPF